MTEIKPNFEHEYVTRQQAAAYLQVTPQTISKLIFKGLLDGAKIGAAPNSGVRVSVASIEKFLATAR